MATKKKAKGQASALPLAKVRSGLAALKKVGLFSGDVRAAKGGWRQRKLLKTYDDVLKGKAKAVKVGKDASVFDKQFRAKNGRVVVKVEKDERVTYSKKSKRLQSTREEYGVKYKRIITNKRVSSPQDIPDNPPKGKKWLYKLPHNPLVDHEGIVELLNTYKDRKGFTGFMEALEIYEMNASDFPDSDPEGEA